MMTSVRFLVTIQKNEEMQTYFEDTSSQTSCQNPNKNGTNQTLFGSSLLMTEPWLIQTLTLIRHDGTMEGFLPHVDAVASQYSSQQSRSPIFSNLFLLFLYVDSELVLFVSPIVVPRRCTAELLLVCPSLREISNCEIWLILRYLLNLVHLP